jgi:hypothetical protein
MVYMVPFLFIVIYEAVVTPKSCLGANFSFEK